jgi:methylated-DNA-[protein]-cysteine S-methyltransferase
VPFGVTTSYGVMAKDLGSSARAIGRANATNPICLILPCHRVIGADGSLTGYAYGIEIKRALLEHERAVLARASAAA